MVVSGFLISDNAYRLKVIFVFLNGIICFWNHITLTDQSRRFLQKITNLFTYVEKLLVFMRFLVSRVLNMTN